MNTYQAIDLTKYRVGDKIELRLQPTPALPARPDWAWVIGTGYTPDMPTTPALIVRCQNVYDDEGRRRYMVVWDASDILAHKPGDFAVGLDALAR